MRTCYETTLAGFPIKLEQAANGRFRVTYGAQVDADLTYAEAAKALGLNVMHALACEGQLDNEPYL